MTSLQELLNSPELKYGRQRLANWRNYKADELKVGAWLDALDSLDAALQAIDLLIADKTTCDRCGGSGRVETKYAGEQVCPDCNGLGMLSKQPDADVTAARALLSEIAVDVKVAPTFKLTKAQLRALRLAVEQDGMIDSDNRLRFGHGNNFGRTLDILLKYGLIEQAQRVPYLYKITDAGRAALKAGAK